MHNWSDKIRMTEVREQGLSRRLEPDAAQRKAIARDLDLVELPLLCADVTVKPWYDGVEVDGRWRAEVVQTCGVTLERLESALEGDFTVRIVPEGSPQAPSDTDLGDIDPEADDPPEVSETAEVDLAALVYEHLALEIDPFPRKAGAEFTAPQDNGEMSPFAVLKQLKKEP